MAGPNMGPRAAGMSINGNRPPNPGMMNSMPQAAKQEVKVKLRNREHGYYSNMFTKVDPNDTGKVTG